MRLAYEQHFALRLRLPRTFDIRRRRRHVVSHIRCAFRRLTRGYFANLMPFAAAAAEMKAREPHANIFFFIIHSPLEWFSLIKESRLFHWPKGTLIFSFLVSKEEWGGGRGVVWDCWLEGFSHIFWRAEVAQVPDGKRFTQKRNQIKFRNFLCFLLKYEIPLS